MHRISWPFLFVFPETESPLGIHMRVQGKVEDTIGGPLRHGLTEYWTSGRTTCK